MKKLSLALASIAIGLAGTFAMADITVTGTGTVSVAPDMATMSLGVTHQDKEASEAMRQTSEAVAAMLGQLESAGIAKSDIQTRNISVNPIWSNRRATDGEPARITGFVASNTVSVRILDLSKLGDVLDQVLSAGANDFGGLSFGLQDPGPVTNQARKAAVADAMAKAELYAQAAGVKIEEIKSISESGGEPRPVMMRAAAMSESAVPIAEGEVTITASVTMKFEIDD